ncbi:hypothetical protein ACFZBU_29370 [Embleya sp. NPDC008237]|uniref:hypothetical protein n=1 Tax=Embleya sp. NPDC008237 TaxID=3363978 RepID=UPI0036E75704
MSVTAPTPGAAEPEEIPEPPEFPYRPLPANLARRVRRRAYLHRLRHVLGSGLLAGAVIGGVWLATPATGGGGGLPPAPSDPTPLWPIENIEPPRPRTDVGLGGSAWIGYAGPEHSSSWCLGSAAEPSESTESSAPTCRFLPAPGRLDTATLDPGVYAPTGQRLVVAILVGQSMPAPAVRGELREATGARQMRLDRPPGLPGVAYLWAFSTETPVSITVFDEAGNLVTACSPCTGTTR